MTKLKHIIRIVDVDIKLCLARLSIKCEKLQSMDSFEISSESLHL